MADDQDSAPTPPSDSGADLGWTALGYLLAGVGGWSFLGWLAERLLGLPKGIGLVTGMLLGATGAVYLIVKRLGA